MQSFKKIKLLLGHQAKSTPFLVIFFILIGLFDLITLYIVQPVIAKFTGSDSLFLSETLVQTYFGYDPTINDYLIILIISFLFKFLAALSLNFLIIRFSQNFQVGLRLRIFKSIYELNLNNFEKKPITEYVHAIQVLAEQFCNNVLTPVLKSASDIVISIMVLGYLTYLSWPLTVIVSLMFGLSYLLYTNLFRNLLSRYGREATKASAEITRISTESFKAYRELKLYDSYPGIQFKLGAECVAYGKNFLKYSLVSAMPRYYFEFVFSLIIGLIIIYFNFYDVATSQAFEILAVFILSSMRLLPALHSLSQFNMLLKFNQDCLDRLCAITEHDGPQNAVLRSTIKRDAPSIRVKLHNAGFSHDKKLFENLSFEMNSGDRFSIIGPSGVGKSTLLDLILGFRQPTFGSVERLVDGVAVEPEQLWQYCSFIAQDTSIFSGTLKDNLLMFSANENFNELKARQAISFAQLDNFFDSLEEGFNFKVDQFGSNLSGGQLQRLSWARAYYRDTPIVIIDEGTSALDRATEEKLLRGILESWTQKLIIFVTHKPERLNLFDKSIIFNENSVWVDNDVTR